MPPRLAIAAVTLHPSPAAEHTLLLHDQLLAPPMELSADVKKLLEDYYRLGQQLPQPQRLGAVQVAAGTAGKAAAVAAPSTTRHSSAGRWLRAETWRSG